MIGIGVNPHLVSDGTLTFKKQRIWIKDYLFFPEEAAERQSLAKKR